MPGGLVKPKKYDWKDSNMALFGSDKDRKVKKDSAKTEQAWKGAGQKEGLQIWRINKFKVEHWAKDEYGSFYNGDSYIILNTYKEGDSDELLYDVHFWIGKYSTQDEYGTAAYKTVELDTLLDDKPIQHREVMGHESGLFKSYFDNITVMKGGCDTGFKRVQPTKYPPRLFQVRGQRRKITCTEIPLKRGNLNSEDVFIIDLGLQIYQYNGNTANKDERYNATQHTAKLRSERGGKPKVEILEEKKVGNNHPIFKKLKQGKSKDKKIPMPQQKSMHKLSDAKGKLEMEEVMRGGLSKDKLNSNDVFLVDTGYHVFAFVGKFASVDERRNSMTYAHNYLMKQEDPFKPVTVISEGQKSCEFDAIWF